MVYKGLDGLAARMDTGRKFGKISWVCRGMTKWIVPAWNDRSAKKRKWQKKTLALAAFFREKNKLMIKYFQQTVKKEEFINLNNIVIIKKLDKLNINNSRAKQKE